MKYKKYKNTYMLLISIERYIFVKELLENVMLFIYECFYLTKMLINEI